MNVWEAHVTHVTWASFFAPSPSFSARSFLVWWKWFSETNNPAENLA
jgi:hypothetical protein